MVLSGWWSLVLRIAKRSRRIYKERAGYCAFHFDVMGWWEGKAPAEPGVRLGRSLALPPRYHPLPRFHRAGDHCFHHRPIEQRGPTSPDLALLGERCQHLVDPGREV